LTEVRLFGRTHQDRSYTFQTSPARKNSYQPDFFLDQWARPPDGPKPKANSDSNQESGLLDKGLGFGGDRNPQGHGKEI
jgi:hypothetical protein